LAIYGVKFFGLFGAKLPQDQLILVSRYVF